jgi:putative membrane protein
MVPDIGSRDVRADMMLAHAGQPVTPHDLWRAWSFEPAVITGLAVTAAIYARGFVESSSRSRRGRNLHEREALFFVSGFTVLAIALLSPVHTAGTALFSAHMIQHELLMAIGAPLLVLGRPALPLMWGLPVPVRKPVGRLLSTRAFRRVWAVLTRPLAAFLAHGAAIWIWHTPRLYDASITSELVHTAQHMSFLVTALIFWWSVFPARRLNGRQGYAIVYLFLTGIHTTLLGALFTIADTPLFSAYAGASTLAWGLTPLEDQQLGGLIMWVPGGLVYLAAALYLMLTFIRESGARVAERDSRRRTAIAANAARIATVVVIALISSSCTNHDTQWAAEMTGGTPARGREAIRSYGCPACHTIPGIAGAKSLVGPPLAGIASRSYIAGVLSNTPTHMIEWLRDPPGIDSKTAMPNMHVTERDARDIAAYLYTLK